MAADAATRLGFGFVTYEAGVDLPALDGSARAYRLESVDEAAVRRVADAFGLAGRLEGDGNGGWTAVDGDLHAVGVPRRRDRGATTRLTRCPPPVRGAGLPPACAGPDCSVSSDPVTTVAAAGAAPLERPADLPSQEDAETIARDVLAEIGVAIDGAQVQVDDNTLSWSFTFDPVVDGTPTYGYSNSVSIGAGGAVIDGDGVIGTPAQATSIRSWARRAAVDRLTGARRSGRRWPPRQRSKPLSPMSSRPRATRRFRSPPRQPHASTSNPAPRRAATPPCPPIPRCSARRGARGADDLLPRSRLRQGRAAAASAASPDDGRRTGTGGGDADRRRGRAGLPAGDRRERRLVWYRRTGSPLTGGL